TAPAGVSENGSRRSPTAALREEPAAGRTVVPLTASYFPQASGEIRRRGYPGRGLQPRTEVSARPRRNRHPILPVRSARMGPVTTAASGPGAAESVVDLGHDVYQIDTFMAGYSRITAGYLIRGDRPCLVETGTAPSAPLVREALAGLGVGPADLA